MGVLEHRQIFLYKLVWTYTIVKNNLIILFNKDSEWIEDFDIVRKDF